MTVDNKIEMLLKETKIAINALKSEDYETFYNSFNKRDELYESINQDDGLYVFQVDSDSAREIVELDQELRLLMHKSFEKMSEEITYLKLRQAEMKNTIDKVSKFEPKEDVIGLTVDCEA